MDRNDIILDALDISADPFALCELRGECSLGLGRTPAASLHYVLAGKGRLLFKGSAPHEVGPGSLVLVPACQWHALGSYGQPVAAIPDCLPAELNLTQHLAGDEGPGGLSVLCSTVRIGLRGTHGLIDLLQQPLVMDLTHRCAGGQAMAGILAELEQPRMGSRAMIRALLLQCLIALFRTYLGRRDPALRWVEALTEPRLWAALQVMLSDEGGALSVEQLAEAAGMSRSQFALRFGQAFGQGPMEFLRELRLARAAQMLTDTDQPIKRIADLAGFRSRSAFTRAFSAFHGVSPQQFRQTPRE